MLSSFWVTFRAVTAQPTVVVVDDAPDVRRLLRTRLRLSGRFEVVGEGADGDQAVALAEQHRPTLMLLDVSMPGADGLEALPRVLAASPRTRVVVFSGFEEHGLADRALALGATAFLEKAVPLDEVVDRLLDLVGEEPATTDRGGTDAADHAVLDEHRERFREVFDEAAIGMATMTLTGRLIRVNRALARLVGQDTDGLVGTPYAELVTDPQGSLEHALDDIRSTPVEVIVLEHRLARGATPTTVRTTLAPVRDSAGRALYLFMQLQDVTAEREAVEQLRRSEERFRLLVEAVEDYAIFMLDPTGHIISWNSGAQRSKLYTAEDIIGQHFRVFYPPEVQAAGHPEHELELALRDGQYEEEGWRIRKDGTRFWATVLITAVFNSAGQHVGFAKVTRDTSERRRMQQEREHTAAALAAANRELEMLNQRLQRSADDQGQFLAVTAHELRSPLGVLAGSADILAKHVAELTDEERADITGAISTSSARLRRLLADLLTASRLQSSALHLDRAPVDLRSLVEAVAVATRSTYPMSEVVVDDDLPDATLVADRDRLAQVLENLAGNAARHGASPIRLGASVTPTHVQVRVVDSGTGVPEDVRARLFDRFATGRAGGTGLGLYIARQLARAHGGDTRYEPPTPDRPAGAFVLELPRHAETAPST